MFNLKKLRAAIESYKAHFIENWKKGECFKWKAVKHFQDHWDVNAPDFLSMFMEATLMAHSLLASMNNYPRGMIKSLATADAEAVRAMFLSLFDESRDVSERIEKFQADAESMRLKYDDGTWRQHYQSHNAITTYLWLRYPDKYYIYKYSEMRAVTKTLESDFVPKKGSSIANILGGFKLYDEICEILKRDASVMQMLEGVLTENCYHDPELRTLTIDVGFFISRYYGTAEAEPMPSQPAPSAYWPSIDEYDPKLTKEDWKKYILEVEKANYPYTMQMLKAMMELGGEASCKELSAKYGGHPSAYVGSAMNFGRRVKKHFNLPPCMDGDNDRVFSIPFLGRNVKENGVAIYTYKIRPELHDALKELDLSDVPSAYGGIEMENSDCNYWWLNANPKIWSFADIEIGEIQSYTLFNDNGNKRRIFQNFLDAKAGDMVIGYESTPVKQVVAIAKIAQANDGENLYFEKVEGLANPIDHAVLKSCPELEYMEYFAQPQGSLFKLTKDEYEFIIDLIRETNGSVVSKDANEPYTQEDFLKEVYITEERFETMAALLKNKKNLILQGAPGVGKTFAAKRLAYAIMGEKDDSRIEFIQFHQNYSYEDFIMGYKPYDNGFKLTNGIFYQFCQNAANHPDKEFFFIIDEINRGNMSKIFGELLMLIERDYRGTKATLAYSGMPFSVPKNLYIIGMMNTADRSLAMIDYALRRRFSFFEMEPGFNSDGFKVYQETFHNETFNTLIERIKELNKEIIMDDSLGAGFRIGHSYFCGQSICTDEWMKEVVYYDIIPMLQEYWFDDKQKLQRWENSLSGVFND